MTAEVSADQHCGMPESDASGLSDAQAQERLKLWGPNRLPQAERRGWSGLLRQVFAEPMFLLLIAAAGIYLALGDPAEGLLLASFALVTVGLVVVQGYRRERALEALRDLAAPLARVRRQGQWRQCPSIELVPGDLMEVHEGDRVAADARLIEAVGLAVDESLLTGESVPVPKRSLDPTISGAVAEADLLGESCVWAGTLVVSGHAWALVTNTGSHTRMGAIGAALSSIDLTPTPLERHLKRLVQRLGVAALAVCAMLIVILGLSGGDWMQGSLSALALGMGMMPEEFPMVLTVFMSMGAWRLSRLQVLARRPAVIEALGAVTMLCVDKTGTLTENRLRLWALQSSDLGWRSVQGQPVPQALEDLARAAMGASRADSFDPIDQAVQGALGSCNPGARLQREWPVSDQCPMAFMVWRQTPHEVGSEDRNITDGQVGGGDRQSLMLFAKGAPEALWPLCGLDEVEQAALHDRVADLAAQGFRVLGVAQAAWCWPEPSNPMAMKTPLQWLGLLIFMDPLRPTVRQAVAQARQAGVEVAMITGDHLETARAIARQAGLDVVAGALSGQALQSMNDRQRQQAVQSVRVFARVSPQQKLLLVRAFQAGGQVVAMTGDGVNDGPALKAAQVGIAMGRRGTDVAREAAGLVLLDEDFGRIVQGIAMGRRIFDNLQRVSAYIVAIHIPLASLALLPLLMGWPPLLLPAHVVLIEMVVDPACSLAFEAAPGSSDLMRRPPRPVGQGLLTRAQALSAVGMGVAVAVASLLCFAAARSAGWGDEQGRALALVCLTVGNLSLVGSFALRGGAARAHSGFFAQAGSLPLMAVCAAALGALALGLWWPWAAQLLQVEPPTFWAIAVAALAAGSAVWLAIAIAQIAPAARSNSPSDS